MGKIGPHEAGGAFADASTVPGQINVSGKFPRVVFRGADRHIAGSDRAD
jgi:hypothetical protein